MLFIPFLLEAAAVLATLVHPNHIVCLCSWGFTHLPPTCNSKLFGYSMTLSLGTMTQMLPLRMTLKIMCDITTDGHNR
ncbi:hypothetical protein B8U03_14800 [Vibrio cholerae]|nr:hypothetical protein B7972_18120 [Vibrio cholerae]ORP97808.1 hypothetical protein B7981_03630 [Vibrio cholerae]ORR28359.1 hypothetical protein B8U03_14800 [Vibrio cholerae]